MTEDVNDFVLIGELRQLVKRQRVLLEDAVRDLKTHHDEFGFDAEMCPTCAFWVERAEDLRRSARRLGCG